MRKGTEMSRFVVHGGTHKTGSSALQRALRAVRAPLREAGVALPGLAENEAKHGPLIRDLEQPAGEGPRAAFVAAARALPAPVLRLVTNETIIGAEPSALRRLLAEAGASSVRLVFYVRPHVALYTSLYLQSLKSGATLCAPQTYDGRTKRAFDYIPAIEAYATEFGAEAVTVREFGRGLLAGGSILADAWALLDLPPAILPQARAAETEANPTPSAEIAALALAFNRALEAELGPRQPDKRQAAVFGLVRQLFALSGLPATPFRLPLDLQRQIDKDFAPARAAFAARWFDRPTSEAWQHEPLDPPALPRDLPLEPVLGAFDILARRLVNREQGRLARLTRAFAASLPRAKAAGQPVLAMSGMWMEDAA